MSMMLMNESMTDKMMARLAELGWVAGPADLGQDSTLERRLFFTGMFCASEMLALMAQKPASPEDPWGINILRDVRKQRLLFDVAERHAEPYTYLEKLDWGSFGVNAAGTLKGDLVVEGIEAGPGFISDEVAFCKSWTASDWDSWFNSWVSFMELQHYRAAAILEREFLGATAACF